MKKILSIFSSLSLILSPVSIVVACGPTELKFSPFDEMDQMVTDRAKGLIISDQFNLNQKAVYKAINPNQERYHELFNESSVAANLNLKNSPVGLPGSFLNDLLPKDFRLTDILSEDIITSIIDANGSESIDINSTSGAEQLGAVIEALFLETGDIDYALSVLGDLTTFIEIIFGLFLGIDFSGMGAMIETIRNQIDQFLKTNLSWDKVQPIFKAVQKGTDLTRFQDLTLTELNYGIILSFTEALNYGLNQDYLGLDLTKILEDDLSTSSAMKAAAKQVHSIMKNPDLLKLNFTNNLDKMLENLLTGVSILNLFLSVYRTAEVDFTNVDQDSVNFSLHLFSKTEENNLYVANQGKVLVKDLTIEQVLERPDGGETVIVEPRNLKGFNYGEFLANIQYYFGQRAYQLQKFFFLFFHTGQLNTFTPFVDFLMNLASEALPLIQNFLEDIKKVLVKDFFDPLVNNQRLHLDQLPKDFSHWYLVDILYPGLKNKLSVIENLFGDASFSTMYFGNLEEIWFNLKDIIGNETHDNLTTKIKILIGNHSLNLETLFTKVKLKQFINLATNEPNKNVNIPSYGDAYLNLTIHEFLEEVQTTFPIPINLETKKFPTSKQLEEYYFDFEKLEPIIQEFFYGIGTEESILNQILEILKEPFPLLKILDLVGFVGSIEDLVVKADSFFGKLLSFLAPKIPTHHLDPDNENSLLIIRVYDLKIPNNDWRNDLDKMPKSPKDKSGDNNPNEDGSIPWTPLEKAKPILHDHLTWFLKGLVRFLPKVVGRDDVTKFVTTILNTNEAFKKSVIRETNDNGKILDNLDEIKNYTLNLEFDPNMIKFKDGSSLTGPITRYTFTIHREDLTAPFDFTGVSKIEII